MSIAVIRVAVEGDIAVARLETEGEIRTVRVHEGLKGEDGILGEDGDDGSLIFVQNDAPATDAPEGSLWIDADSTDQDLYQLASGVWTDTGLNVKGAPGSGSGEYLAENPVSAGNIPIFGTDPETQLADSGITPGTMAGETATDYVAKALFDANTVLAADSDNTPTARTIAESEIVGRPAGGNIEGLSASQARTILNVEDGADVTDAGNVGSSIHGASAKTTPVDTDTMPLIDSAASNVLKKVTWANVKATLKTYFDTLYQPLAAALTSWAGVTRASGFDTFVATPSSANLKALVTDETGSGALMFGTSPTITTLLTIIEAGNAAIEIGRVDGNSSTPFIDFHSGATAVDYDARLIASGGSGATAGGLLSFHGTAFRPSVNDVGSLGVSGGAWSDIFLATGALLDFGAGNAVVTHSSGVLNVSTGALQVGGSAVLTALTGQPLDATLTSLAAVAGVQGDLLYASGTDAWTRLAKDANATRYLANTGTTNNPAWAQVNLANGVTGTLPAANLPAATTTAIGAVEEAIASEVYASTADKYLHAGHLSTGLTAVAITDQTPATWVWTDGIYRTLTISQATQIANPTGTEVPGQTRFIYVVGNNTTDRTITFGNQFFDVPTITDCDSGQPYLLVITCMATDKFTVSARKAW